MPVHDWTKVEAGLFHAFHHEWISEISRALTRAYIEAIAVARPLLDMPLFLEPNGCVMVPLEATYETAFAVMPRRWQRVLEGSVGR